MEQKFRKLTHSNVWGPIPKAPLGQSWEFFMQEALLYAKKGASLGEIPVGALIVHKDGRILAKSHNKSIANSDPSAHAEILAMRQAGQILQNYRLQDSYLVVTLEPCLMCTGAIREARLLGVIFGAYDERAGAVCSCLEGLDAPLLGVKTWHLGGILEDQCRDILKIFFKEKR